MNENLRLGRKVRREYDLDSVRGRIVELGEHEYAGQFYVFWDDEAEGWHQPDELFTFSH